MDIETLWRGTFDHDRIVYFTCEDEAKAVTFARLALDKKLEPQRDAEDEYTRNLGDATKRRLIAVERIAPVYRPED